MPRRMQALQSTTHHRADALPLHPASRCRHSSRQNTTRACSTRMTQRTRATHRTRGLQGGGAEHDVGAGADRAQGTGGRLSRQPDGCAFLVQLLVARR